MTGTEATIKSDCDTMPCPVCGNPQFVKRFTKKGRDFWRCNSCGLEKICPLPTMEELKAYYDSSYDSGMYKTFIDAKAMKDLTARQRMKEISAFTQSGRWLDIGCSTGVFVELARENGFEAEGIDLSQVAVEQGQAIGLPLTCARIEDFDPGYKFDVITAFDVLEHVLDPVEFLEAIYSRLSPHGTVIITVPDQGSWIRKMMGPRWYFYIPEEHMHYFNHSTIRQLLGRLGFRVEKVGATFKPLTYNYSLTQFVEYNPVIYKILNAVAKVIPNRVRNIIVPLYIGEMMVIAQKSEDSSA